MLTKEQIAQMDSITGGGSSILDDETIAKMDKTLNAPSVTFSKKQYRPIYEQVNPDKHPIAGTVQDVGGQFGSNFLDQLVAGLARPAIRMHFGKDIPEPTTTAGKVARVAGAGAGFIAGAPAQAGKLIVRGVEKVIPRLAEKGLANVVTRGAIEGGVSGLVSTPEGASTLGEVTNLSKRAEVARNFAIAGGATPIAINAVSKIPATQAGRVINSLIKPLKKDFAYGKNAGRVVASEGIVANNMEELATKIGERRQQVGTEIQEILSQPENQFKSVNLIDSFQPLDDAIAVAKKAPKTNSALIQRLQNVKDDLLGLTYDESGAITSYHDLSDLSPWDATKLKANIGDMTKWTGNPTDDKLVNKALKRIYGSIKGKINTAVPEIAEKNEKFADLTTAEIATKYRDVISKRQNLVGFNTRTAGVGGALLALASGHPAGAVAMGAGTALLDKIVGSTAFKTRLAQGLSGVSKGATKAQPYVGTGKPLSVLNEIMNRPMKLRVR